MQAGKLVRIAVASLTISAAGWFGLAEHEGYVEKAMVPTKGDRPTVGIGSTFRDDGSPVQIGDTIKPIPAIKRSLSHVAKDEIGLKQCITAELNQVEYDLLVDHAYQYGVRTTCTSSMVSYINHRRYVDSCNAYLLYKKSQGRDCSLPENWGPGGCKGVWNRSLWRQQRCLQAQ